MPQSFRAIICNNVFSLSPNTNEHTQQSNHDKYLWRVVVVYLEVSQNVGTPKSSIYRWNFHEINHPANGHLLLTFINHIMY